MRCTGSAFRSSTATPESTDRFCAVISICAAKRSLCLMRSQFFLSEVRTSANEPFQLLAAQKEAELALLETFPHAPFGLVPIVEPVFLAFVRRIDAAIPDDHFARTVLPRRDDALERGVVERVILGLHGEALVGRIERRALGNGPRLEHAIALEAEVVMQPPRRVLLDDEEQRPGPRLEHRRGWLGRGFEGALGGIFAERRRLGRARSIRALAFQRGRCQEASSAELGWGSHGEILGGKTMEMLAGTSGFSYKEWLGHFYPEKLPAAEMLRYYAEHFPTVEINNTFYRMPAESMLARWSEEVPEGFAFTLKAPRRITHEKRLREAESDVAEFAAARSRTRETSSACCCSSCRRT